MFSIIKRDVTADLAAMARDLEEQMNRMVGIDLFFEPLGRSFPKVNIYETEETYVIEAALPGFKKEQIKLEITEHNGHRYLTLKGEKSGRGRSGETRYLSQEVHYSSFHRSWTLPSTVDVDGIKTAMEDGILTIEISKNEPKRTKKEIKIS